MVFDAQGDTVFTRDMSPPGSAWNRHQCKATQGWRVHRGRPNRCNGLSGWFCDQDRCARGERGMDQDIRAASTSNGRHSLYRSNGEPRLCVLEDEQTYRCHPPTLVDAHRPTRRTGLGRSSAAYCAAGGPHLTLLENGNLLLPAMCLTLLTMFKTATTRPLWTHRMGLSPGNGERRRARQSPTLYAAKETSTATSLPAEFRKGPSAITVFCSAPPQKAIAYGAQVCVRRRCHRGRAGQ